MLETTNRDPPEFHRDDPYETALSTDEIRRYDMPGPSSLDKASFVRINPQERLLQLGTRYCVIPLTGDPVNVADADHWGTVDRAPKALIRVPVGDFVFGGTERVYTVVSFSLDRWRCSGERVCGATVQECLLGTR